jgi:hypothetical protein
MQANDLLSRTPLKEHVLSAIIGFALLIYGAFGSKLTTGGRCPQHRVNKDSTAFST